FNISCKILRPRSGAGREPGPGPATPTGNSTAETGIDQAARRRWARALFELVPASDHETAMQPFKLKSHVSTQGHSAVCCCPGCMGLGNGNSAQDSDSGPADMPPPKPTNSLSQITTQLT